MTKNIHNNNKLLWIKTKRRVLITPQSQTNKRDKIGILEVCGAYGKAYLVTNHIATLETHRTE